MQLTAAAAALREVAGLPAQSGARTERYLAVRPPPRREHHRPALGAGARLSSDEAVALALDTGPGPYGFGGGDTVALTALGPTRCRRRRPVR